MSDGLRLRIQEDMKALMRAKDATTLGTVRLLWAAIKQREVDERITLDDTEILVVISKMIKQRRDSMVMYEQGQRQDLAGKEAAEIAILNSYLPIALTEHEIESLVKEAVSTCAATSIKDMSKVMTYLKPKVQGRADMGKIGGMIKSIIQPQ